MNRQQRREAARAQRRQANRPTRPPRWNNGTSGLDLIRQLTPFEPHEITALALPPRVAFDALKAGRADAEDFDTLACITNVALVRSESIGPQAVQVAKEAQDALMRIKARQARTGSLGVTHADVVDLLGALDLHEQIIELSTPQELTDAYREVLRRMETGATLK